jgi:hypothetical protein
MQHDKEDAARFMQHYKENALRPFAYMLACSAAIAAALLVVKIFSIPRIQYIHLLVTYDFGVIKRAMIGELLSFFRPKVGFVDVFVLGVAMWLSTLITYLFVFRKTFGFSERTFPLLAMILCSPFFFKNFMFSVGYFDIFGCLAALIALLLPVNLALPLCMGAIACFLLFVHHLHLLLYVPTIALIVILRTVADGRVNLRLFALAGAGATIVIGGAFYYLAFHGSVPIPMDEFTAALKTRAIDAPEIIGGYLVRIFYTDIAHEIRQTMEGLPNNARRFPVYALLIYLHLPLISYFRRLIRALPRRPDRLLVLAGLIGITLGYVVIGAVVFDYPRWVANWAVCMILMMHAVRSFPSPEADTVPIDPTIAKNRWFGWILTLIPRVGISKPF